MDFTELKQVIAGSSNIVFFGGAGTSTESGIPDFRSTGGLYQTQEGGRYAPEEMLSHDFFMEQTEAFYTFYRQHMIHASAQPNAAHEVLARLERQGRLRAVVTQNIDGLHQRAGSERVLELHGTVHRNLCMNCGAGYGLEAVTGSASVVPRCSACGGILKPDVVLYQESLNPHVLEQAQNCITNADVLIVGGTSLSVYPAAGLVRYYNGNHLVLINKSATPYDGYANYVIQDSVGKVLQELAAD